MSTTSDEESSGSFTFEEYINLIRYESNGNLSSVDLLTSDSANSQGSSSKPVQGRTSTSPLSNGEERDEGDGEEWVDPVEREIISKRQMTDEINEAELSSKEKLELHDKLDPNLHVPYVTTSKERKKIRKKSRRKSLGTLTLIGNSVSCIFHSFYLTLLCY